MQAHKYLLAILTISFAGQITAQVAAPKATTSTKDQAVKKTESTSTQAKDGVNKAETTVKDILGDKKNPELLLPIHLLFSLLAKLLFH